MYVTRHSTSFQDDIDVDIITTDESTWSLDSIDPQRNVSKLHNIPTICLQVTVVLKVRQ